MSIDQTVKTPGRPRILVVPLDWGLGHSTRCIPVIYELIRQGAEVWLAGEGAQKSLLKTEFPHLPFLPLRGYRVKYGRSKWGLLGSVLWQAPGILRSIKRENNWLRKMVQEHGFNAVIADNRYGLYHPGITTVFITHQLRIQSPFGKLSASFLQKTNYRYINRFTECWVPDTEIENGLAGELSHPVVMPTLPVRYIGHLSRLKKNQVAEKKGQLFISLSGPEPQRTQFEDRVINEVCRYNGTAVIVRGLPGEERLIPSTNDIVFYNHLPADRFAEEMARAEYVISRSGYSTVMDLITLEKKSLLVPTPGQSEQEYLAAFLTEKKFAPNLSQQKFSLPAALQKAAAFDYRVNYKNESTRLSSAISSLLHTISAFPCTSH